MNERIRIDGVLYVRKEEPIGETQTNKPEEEDKPKPERVYQMYPIICSRCGKKAEVPFKPKEGWNVYCPECYEKSRRIK